MPESVLWWIGGAIRYVLALGLVSLFLRALKRMKKDISLPRYIGLCLLVGPLMLILLMLVYGLGTKDGPNAIVLLEFTVSALVSGWGIIVSKRVIQVKPYVSRFSECRDCGYIGAFKRRCPKCKSTDVSGVVCCERDVTKLTPDDFELKWHTVFTEWLLWLEVILCFILAMQHLTGAHYYGERYYATALHMTVERTPELMYEIYGLPLRMLDIFMVLAFCALAIFVIITRAKLERFDKDALKYLCGIIAAGGGLRLLYSVVLIAMISLNEGTDEIHRKGFIAALCSIATVLMLSRSCRYYDERKILFENGPFEKTNLEE